MRLKSARYDALWEPQNGLFAMRLEDVFAPLPDWLRKELLVAYNEVVENFVHERWESSSLNAGKFSEAVYVILKGYPPDTYDASKQTISDFPGSCRRLESQKPTSVPDSIRILLPRTLPGVYDIRNNRGVGHISSELDANRMDATFGLATCSFVLAELVRVFVSATGTAFSAEEAQALVEEITTAPALVVWRRGDVRRVLDTTLNLPDQIVLLVAAGAATKGQLRKATEHYTDQYLAHALERLHVDRLVEFDREAETVTLTAKGFNKASQLTTAFQSKTV